MRMGSCEAIILSCCCFFLFFLPAMITGHEENCSPKTCHKGEPKIRFPFRLEGLQWPQCGYPGFNLACNNLSKTILRLPSSGFFFVRDIDYVSQDIQIYDPDNCLPRRLLYLNLSGSPFQTVYHHNYTLFNCSSSDDLSNSSLIPIDCLGSSTHKVWATSNSSIAELRITGCEFVANVKVPSPWLADTLGLENDLHLSWSNPYCRPCESGGGKCGFNSTSHEIGCYTHQAHGITTVVVCILGIGIGLLPALVMFCVCCVYASVKACCDRADDGVGGGEHHPSNAEFSTAVLPEPLILEIGLDDSVIDSYPKIVLGASGRLPKPDDNACPICLLEYQPKEVLKIIPDCNHGFHAHCIDDWLHRKGTCPVCRNSLLPLLHGL